jgi:hypothetical protein
MSCIGCWPGENRIGTIRRLACTLASLAGVAFSLMRRSSPLRLRGRIALIGSGHSSKASGHRIREPDRRIAALRNKDEGQRLPV